MNTIRKLVYGWIDKKFLGGCSSYNSLATRKRCRSKRQAREAFAANNIPHAPGAVFYGLVKPFIFAKKHGFPLCVKPNVSGFSRGSHFPIMNYRELFKAVILVKIWWPSSIVEQYLKGKNYRVAVVKDEIMSVIRRYPPFVVGDGSSTIAELIDRENSIREKMGLYPVIHPISKKRSVARFLQKQKLNFDSVPGKDETVVLYNRISLAPGGVVEIIDKANVHPDNTELFCKLLSIFNANILGIDAIFETGIEFSHKQQQVIFLEVNSRPYLRMHDYPRYGEKEDLQPYYAALDSLNIEERDIF